MIRLAVTAFVVVAGAAVAQAEAPAGQLLLVNDSMHTVRDGGVLHGRSAWRITIRPAAGGWRVEGRRVASDISGPASAAALIAVARADPESGRLPLRLDAQGQIADPPPPIDPQTMALIRAAVQRHFAQAAMTEAQRTAAQPLIAQLMAQQTETPWPPMLFRPTPGTRHDTRTVQTGAGPGTLDRTEVVRVDRGGWLRSLDITLVTDVGGTTRRSREVWTMAPAGRRPEVLFYLDEKCPQTLTHLGVSTKGPRPPAAVTGFAGIGIIVISAKETLP